MSDDEDVDLAVLETGTEKADGTIERQLDQLRTLDAKAIEVIGVDTVLVGLVLTGSSLVTDVLETEESQTLLGEFLVNDFFLFGIASLFVSVAVAASAYGPQKHFVGYGPGGLRWLLAETADRPDDASGSPGPDDDAEPSTEPLKETFYRTLADEYVSALDANEALTVRRALRVSSAILLTVTGVAALALGFYDVFVTSLPVVVALPVGLGVVLLAYLLGLFRMVRRVIDDRRKARADERGEGGEETVEQG